MTIDIELLNKSLKKVEVEVNEKIVETQGKLALTVDQTLVLSTPVDTGRARANWLPSINSPVTKFEEELYDKDGFATIGKAGVVIASLKVGDEFIISNNAPYIGALNDGHSKQAPAGFVEKAIQAAVSAIL